MAQPSRTFRIFVSSTFSDLKAERNALQERVFPKLRELCMQHGARFQAIDLRWGVSEEAAVDQQTMNICLEELRRCQRITPRPNVIVLLGERYGWMPLPPQIPAEEFESILERVSPEDRDLLLWRDHQPPDAKGWYRYDDNAAPPEYVLQPRAGEHERYADSARWAELEARLHRILFDAVQQVNLPEAARGKYERSATEQEILEGAFQAGTDHAFCYFRTIEGLLQDEHARDFLDLDERGIPASDAQARLEDLKARLRRHFPAEHIYDYQAGWSGEGLTEDHLDALCARVEADLSRVILEQIAGMAEQDDLTREIEAHRRFGEERCRHFIGREEIIEQIRDYVRRGDNHPLVVWGVSGSGKSALMARCAELIHQKLPSARLIHRFIGATPASTDIRSLLESLCREIYRTFDYDEQKRQRLAEVHGADEQALKRRQEIEAEYEMPMDIQKLPDRFGSFLAKVPPNRRLVLFLDALDQLSPTDNAHTLNWLPRDLPDNVRIVAAALEREGPAGECLRVARARLPETSLVAVTPLTPEQGGEILNVWLRETKRTLQGEQRADILSKFERCPVPLYLKLAFEEARRWKSYDGLPCGADEMPGLFEDIEGIIKDMLWRLEQPAHHGQTLVSKAMGYLAAARNGLTEDEILDVLSADDDMMADFRRRSPRSPDVDRLPVVVWSRLYFDLEPYLTERAADNTSLLSFYHRQLGEVAAGRYLAGESGAQAHSALAYYFGGLSLWMGDPEAHVPNHRKCSELPYHQTHGELWPELEATLTDLVFIEAKCTAGMTYDLVRDYTRTEAVLGDRPRLQAFGSFMKRQAHILNQYPEIAFQQAINEPETRDTCRVARMTLESGLVRRPWFAWIKRPETQDYCIMTLSVQGTPASVGFCAYSADGNRILSASDVKIKIWDAQTAEEVATLDGHCEHASTLALAPEGNRIVSASDVTKLRVWDTRTGTELAELSGHSANVMACAWSHDGKRIVSASADGSLKVWDAQTGDELATLIGHSDWVTSCAWSQDGKTIASGSRDGTLKVWDVDSAVGARVRAAERVRTFAWSADGRRVAAASWEGVLRVWEASTGVEVATWPVLSNRIYSCAWSPNGERIICGSQEETLEIRDSRTGISLLTLTERIPSCPWSPDGKKVVTSPSSWSLGVRDTGTGVELWTWDDYPDVIMHYAWSPEGQRVAYSCMSPDRRGCLKVLELVGAGGITASAEGCGWPFAWSPDGRRIVSASTAGSLRILDLHSRSVVMLRDADSSARDSCGWSPDSERIVSGSRRGTLAIWHAQSGQELAAWPAHSEGVAACSYSPDGRLILSASPDTTLGIWDGETCRRLATFVAGRFTTALLGGTGSVVAALDESGKLYLLRFGAPFVTAWRWPVDTSDAFGCTLCREWSEIPESALGTELACPTCGKAVKLNPFTINADWRSIAAAWRGSKEP